MTLSNTGIAQDSVVYAVSSTASACAGPATNYTIYVNPDAKANYTYPYDTACWPYAIVINNTSPLSPGNINIPNSSYNWYTINQLGTETLIGSGSLFPGHLIQLPSDSIKIKMVSISAFGCKNDSLTHVFYTKPKPTAAFTMSNRDSCGPLTISFINQTNIRDTFRYQWNFGNGQTSTATNPSPVTYVSNPRFFDTTYYIKMRAFNECDTTIYLDSVIVRADPKARFAVSSSSGCSPFTIQINNSSLGNPHTYYWDFGDGTPVLTTTTLGTLSHTYYTGVVDTFELKLVAISACGSDTQRIKIRVAPNVIIPGVSVTATELYGCVSHSVNFINNSTGATNFIWDFGDGTLLQPTNFFQTIVNHTYNTAGTFNVQINMTNGCSDTSINTSITVYPRPTAAFTTNQTVYCLGDTTRFINNSINATNYTWSLGNGVFNTNSQPNYVYLNPGVYNIQLQAQQSNATGLVCFDTITRSITILSKPDTAIITNIRTANCSPYLMTASVPGFTTELITWYVYDTTLPVYPVVIANPTLNYTFNNSGRFKVVMVIENALGCKDSTFRFLNVYAKPLAAFTPLNLATCSLDTIASYINNSTANIYTPLSYHWYVDGIQLATSGNFTYRYTALPSDILPKIFDTKLVATNSVGCADSVTGRLQMNPTAKSIFTLINPQACIPFVAAINNSSTYASNYQWYLDGVLVSTNENPIINITTANTSYTVTLIVSNIYACRPDTSRFTFRTRIMPIAAFSFNDTLGCLGELAVITTNTSQHANAYTWEWGDASANSTLNNPTHLFSSVGNYNTLLTASDGVCTDTVSHAVVVSQKPTANFIANNVKNCDTSGVRLINLTANATSFLWTISNGYTTTETSPTIILNPSVTSYSVTLLAINEDGCRDSLTRANYIKVYVMPQADFTITPSPTIYIPNYTFGFLNLTPDYPIYKYNWSLGDGSFAITRDVVSHLYNDTGNYEVRLTVLDTTTSCVDTVIKYARIVGNPGYLYVPNAFYANSTQLNFKYFKPLGKGLAEYELLIFDSWGKLLFRTTKLDYAGSPVDGWDGTYKGAPMPQDAYAWKIKARFRNGKIWEGMNYDQSQQGQPAHSFGTITLFR
jgi:PKD repeat protein